MKQGPFTIAVLALWGHLCTAEQPLIIVEDGRPRSTVILSAGASPSEKWAAEQFVSHVEQMSGAKLDLRIEPAEPTGNAIFIGDGEDVRSLGGEVDTEGLGIEGFVIKCVGRHLVIAGGRQRGTMLATSSPATSGSEANSCHSAMECGKRFTSW